MINRSAKMLWDFIFGQYKQAIIEDTPAFFVRNEFEDMHVEMSDGLIDGPFPCITIKIYPNGKAAENNGRYTFRIIPNRIIGWYGKNRDLFQVQDPAGAVVFSSVDRQKVEEIYFLVCGAFNDGVSRA